jgi:serpin B
MEKSKGVRFVTMAILVAMLGTLVAGCAKGEAQAQVVQSRAQREGAPNVARADVEALVAGNSAFAFDLYQALAEEGGNLFFSPFSISAALAMTYAGARGETERQMTDTLHFTLPQDRLHPAFNALDTGLVGRDQGEDFQLRIANALWGQKGHSFLEGFLDMLAVDYGAGLRLLDFAADPEGARQVINEWVSEQTEERIKDLIPQGGVDAATRLVLANAIYFFGKWAHPFDASRTRDGVFYTLDGREMLVPMMRMPEAEGLPYLGGDGYQAVELPYQGEEMSLLILAPDEDRFEEFQADLDAQFVQAVVEELAPRQVYLTLPKFSYESEFSLARMLTAMGMPDAFGAADFSGMDGTQNLFISDVFHKAFVAVDEAGTEAAAATAVVVGESLPMVDVTLTIDRPFVFLIRDRETGSILFLGRVVAPS